MTQRLKSLPKRKKKAFWCILFPILKSLILIPNTKSESSYEIKP